MSIVKNFDALYAGVTIPQPGFFSTYRMRAGVELDFIVETVFAF
jgi:hypothetical protein